MTTEHEAEQQLWRACLHEYAHYAVARHFGAAGFVTIARGRLDPSRYGGRFQMHGELADDEWRIVALAGTVAESIDADPSIDAASVIAALRAEPTPLSGVDAQLASGFLDADVERCLRIVRTLWQEIAREAAERAESHSTGN